jgi:enoyl-CoA hydratase
MSYENLLTEKKNHTLYITINRASKLNALNKAVLSELHGAFSAAAADKEVQAIILTGDGTKAFVAGADISEFAHFSVEEGKRLSAEGHRLVFDFIANSGKPVIAAINGFALGGGLELAMSCHIRVASDNAKMGLPEVSLGVIPGYGGTQRLTQLVGKGKALEMIVTADMVDAQEAYRIGLVNHVTTAEGLIAKCEEIAAKIISKSPVAISHAIKALNASLQDGVNGFEVEIDEFGKCFGTADFKEGTTAFLEKRKAAFKGE